MKRIEDVAEVGALRAAAVCFSQYVEFSAVPNLGKVKDGRSKIVHVASGDSSIVV